MKNYRLLFMAVSLFTGVCMNASNDSIQGYQVTTYDYDRSDFALQSDNRKHYDYTKYDYERYNYSKNGPHNRRYIKELKDDKGKRIAYIDYELYPKGENMPRREWRCSIRGIKVESKYRNRGIGTQLVNAVVNEAQQVGCRQISLFPGMKISKFPWDKGNGFFTAMGFRPDYSPRYAIYTPEEDDTVRMIKKLEKTSANAEGSAGYYSRAAGFPAEEYRKRKNLEENSPSETLEETSANETSEGDSFKRMKYSI